MLEKIKSAVILAASSPDFFHNDWYVEHHLQVVAKLVNELCDLYPEANRELALMIGWMHDYGKIIDRDNQYQYLSSQSLLAELGIESGLAELIIESIKKLDSKTDLENASIEVQIVSSADGASHLVGPFQFIYWSEFHDRGISQLMSDSRKKLQTDWSSKITLPEVRAAFQSRHDSMMLIMSGEQGTLI